MRVSDLFSLKFSGSKVEIDFTPGVDPARRREIVEGPMRGLSLYADGCFVLHGSCVCVDGFVISIVGAPGAGKSTLAASLCERGAALVSDGMTPIRPDSLSVVSGPPLTKLNDESLRLMRVEPSEFLLVHPSSTKRYFPVRGILDQDAFPSDEPYRIRAVYIVEDSDLCGVSALGGARSLIALVSNAYMVSCLPPEHSSILMQRAAALINNGVQVKALRRRKEPGELPRIIECIERAASGLH